jgi:molecular chaperone DnaK (HSP70)
MSVVGFDIGNFKSSVGVARQGGIEIVANEYSDRITPTYVSFSNNERHQGHSAKQQEITNSQNTITCFKRLLARKYNDPLVQKERNYQPNMRISAAQHDQSVMFNVDYLNELKHFTCEQIMGMFFTKLKTIAEMNMIGNAKVTDCVISVPCYMTDAERRALLDASHIAGLNCLKLMNETTAVALNYGMYHSNLPETNEKPHVVVFVDMGYAHLQVYAAAFNKGKLKMLGTTFDNCLGGRDFDYVLCDYFHQDFKQRFKVDAYSNARARLRLRAECEKLKKLMSSNSSVIPLNIECFMNDTDVSGKMKREEFEKLAEPLLARVKQTMLELLNVTKLTSQDIDLVEIVGGSTRVPIIKHIVQQVFGKEPSTTLNADEACARGCTLQCAMLSPTFKVREFKVEDCQLFPIILNWKGAETDDNELEVFQYMDKIPMSKLLTIYKKEPFEIEARYRYPNNIPYNEPRIGKFFIENVTPNAHGENSEVKIKARITKNGIFEISSPQLIETTLENLTPAASHNQQQHSSEGHPHPHDEANHHHAQDELVDRGKASNGEQKHQDSHGSTSGENDEMSEESSEHLNGTQSVDQQQQNQPSTTKKKRTKAVDLPMSVKVPQLSKNELNNLIEQELSMIQQDKKEKERSEAKNSVEEYIYEARDKLSGDYERFISEDVII